MKRVRADGKETFLLSSCKSNEEATELYDAMTAAIPGAFLCAGRSVYYLKSKVPEEAWVSGKFSSTLDKFWKSKGWSPY